MHFFIVLNGIFLMLCNIVQGRLAHIPDVEVTDDRKFVESE